MAITARLSRAFYERFGEEVVAELVDWMNQMDAASHTSLRELNELNFARFDARVGERLAGQDARIAEQFRSLEVRIAEQFRSLEVRTAEQFRSLEVRIAEQFRSSEMRIVRWVVGIAIAQTGLFVTILLQTR